ncbi:aldehyde dehydrogenase [Alicyclobacillus acidoterrestris]|nr:aldehyde dehydrogenase [Alicyclobacillus acidoterrestris]
MTVSHEAPVYGSYIDGKWRAGSSIFPVLDKYTGEEYANITIATKQDVYDAVTNAWETFHKVKLSSQERYEILMNAVEIFRRRKEEFASIIVCEGGKVLKDAYAEVERGIQTFIASAEEAKRISGSGVPLGQYGNEGKFAFTIRVPVGVIGAITPFNFPFNLVAHKVGPALAAGNTIVLKPAELTPITSCRMVEVLTEAGLPHGFLNVVNGTGLETGQYLLGDERIAMYTFTGSPSVGRAIKSQTGIRKVTLELGNNSPNIVCRDVQDLNRAVRLCVTRGFSNAGQACISVQRIYVHRDIMDQFIENAIYIAKTLKVGNPKNIETDVGPMISEEAAKRVEDWIKEAVDGGAVVVFGGQRDGSVFYPTILTHVLPNMKVVCEEIFAPVISIIPFDDIDEAFKAANATRYGLQVGLFTSNLQLAFRATQELQFGGIIINDVSTFRTDVMPYGGIKDSGVGKEGPHYAIQEMTDEKIVVLQY